MYSYANSAIKASTVRSMKCSHTLIQLKLVHSVISSQQDFSKTSCRKMAEQIEELFKNELYRKYQECQKLLIPKTRYFQMMDELKTAATKTSKKSRQDFYLLKR